MQKHEYNGPMNASQLFNAAYLLHDGQAVTVNGLRLSRDPKLDLVLSTDAYGQDGIAAQSADSEGCVQALRWALAQPPDPCAQGAGVLSN